MLVGLSALDADALNEGVNVFECLSLEELLSVLLQHRLPGAPPLQQCAAHLWTTLHEHHFRATHETSLG